MTKAVVIGIALVLTLFLLPSCAAGVPQEDYDRVSSDLAAAQAQIQSLQADLAKAQAQIQSLEADKKLAGEKHAEALAYAQFIDIIMYPAFKESGIPTRFEFEDKIEWLVDLKNRATEMEEAKPSRYIKEMEKGDKAAVGRLTDYVLGKLEETLK